MNQITKDFTMTENVIITSGSDFTQPFEFQNDTGTALVITNPTVIESTGGLEGKCTATLDDGALGLASVFIEGTAPVAPGVYFLRLQVTLSNDNSLASQRVLVNVQ